METFFDTGFFLKIFEAENKLTVILNVPLQCSDETDKTFFFGLKGGQIFNLIQNNFFEIEQVTQNTGEKLCI